jgi:dihydroflavonol-4-reductase
MRRRWRCIRAGQFYWVEGVARVLLANVPEIANRVPACKLTSWLVRLLAYKDPVIRGRLFELDKQRSVLAERAKRQLECAPRFNATMIIDTTRSLLVVR